MADRYSVGSIVTVRAWWRGKQPTECEVIRTPYGGHSYAFGNGPTYIDVRPREGNPHARMVDMRDVVTG